MIIAKQLVLACAYTLALIAVQATLTHLALFANSNELASHLASVAESQRYHVEDHAFVCLFCGHAVAPQGQTVHNDAYSCMQCRQAQHTWCNETHISEETHHHVAQKVVDGADVPAFLRPALTWVLTIHTIEIHPVVLACVVVSLSVWALYLVRMAGIYRDVVDLREQARHLAALQRPPAQGPVTDSAEPVATDILSDGMRQRKL